MTAAPSLPGTDSHDPILSGILVDVRPWGRFTRYSHNQSVTVKIIEVAAGPRLSLQKHSLHTELWVALDHGPVVEVDGQRWIARQGEEILVRRGAVHRMSSMSRPVRVLEVAFGNFDEDDIERLEDSYGRS